MYSTMLIEIKKGLQNKTDNNNNKLIYNFLEMLLNSFTIDFAQEHVKCKNQYHRFQYTEDGINNNTSNHRKTLNTLFLTSTT